MGSICHINMNPTTWTAFDNGKRLKPEFGGEPLMTVRYGTLDDDPDGLVDLEMSMRKSVYDKLISGAYKISPDSRWRHKLIITDKDGNIIPSLAGTVY